MQRSRVSFPAKAIDGSSAVTDLGSTLTVDAILVEMDWSLERTIGGGSTTVSVSVVA
jgi:hypothetical protein